MKAWRNREVDKEVARHGRSGLTLVELMVVITIIALLMGFLLAAVNLARRRAHVAQAETEVRDLVRAWKSYWMTYGNFAGYESATNQPMTGPVMEILQGDNPQGIIFMDVDEDVTTDGFKDPWGNLYQVDFSQTRTPGVDWYETTVALPNRRRDGGL